VNVADHGRKRIGRENEPKIVREEDAESPARPMRLRSAPPTLGRQTEGGIAMTQIERSIVIDRPVEDVFAFTHDISKNTLWQTTLVESKPLTDGPLQVGSRWQDARRFLGKRVETVMELTEYEPSRSSAMKMVEGPVPLEARYQLEPVNGSTKLTATGELDAHGFFKVAEPVFARMAARELESSLGHLKDLLESEEVPS
jgi:uncharacterized membrane protein